MLHASPPGQVQRTGVRGSCRSWLAGGEIGLAKSVERQPARARSVSRAQGSGGNSAHLPAATGPESARWPTR